MQPEENRDAETRGEPVIASRYPGKSNSPSTSFRPIFPCQYVRKKANLRN